MKNKAKSVKTELKQIVKSKNNIAAIDKELGTLQNELRQAITAPEKKKSEVKKSKLPSINKEQAFKVQRQSEEALKNLDKMQL